MRSLRWSLRLSGPERFERSGPLAVAGWGGEPLLAGDPPDQGDPRLARPDLVLVVALVAEERLVGFGRRQLRLGRPPGRQDPRDVEPNGEDVLALDAAVGRVGAGALAGVGPVDPEPVARGQDVELGAVGLAA